MIKLKCIKRKDKIFNDDNKLNRCNYSSLKSSIRVDNFNINTNIKKDDENKVTLENNNYKRFLLKINKKDKSLKKKKIKSKYKLPLINKKNTTTLSSKIINNNIIVEKCSNSIEKNKNKLENSNYIKKYFKKPDNCDVLLLPSTDNIYKDLNNYRKVLDKITNNKSYKTVKSLPKLIDRFSSTSFGSKDTKQPLSCNILSKKRFYYVSFKIN